MNNNNTTQWGNAIPLGLSGYCLMCLLLGFINLGFVKPVNIAFLTIAAIGITIALFTGGIITLRNGNSLDGNMLSTFGLMFVLGPTLEMYANASGIIEIPMVVFGAWQFLLGIYMIIWAIPLSRAPIFAFSICPLMVCALCLSGFSMILPQFSNVLNLINGWLFLIPGLGWGLYAMAINLSEAMGIQLPVGRPLINKKDINTKSKFSNAF